MTFADWVRDTKQRYHEESPGRATVDAARAFGDGVSRRVLDPHVGREWWNRDDWDVLVILDATRVDLAREVLDVPVESVWSPASTSIDWIERHFAEEYRSHWKTAAYVTANPFSQNDAETARSAQLREKDIGHLDLVFERSWQKDPVGTTPPTAVTEAAIEAWKRTDVERMIVHYMQPHQPFRSRPDWEHVYSNLENLTTEMNQGGPDIWRRIRNGEVPIGEAWNAYADNLWWVWCVVHNDLIPQLDGRVLVTSDHGNGLGEWGSWGHHGGDMNPYVRKVPVMGPFEEGLTVDDPMAGSENTVEDVNIEEQLESLGYL